jgi:hypothetical protein
MAALPQWLRWRFERYEGDKKPRKGPYWVSGRKRKGAQGSDCDRGELTTVDVAITHLVRWRYQGLGVGFLPGDGLIGMDIDGVAGSLWAGFNAITQIETSADPRAGRGSVHRRLHSTYFGAANNIVRVAHGLAIARLGLEAAQFAQTANP